MNPREEIDLLAQALKDLIGKIQANLLRIALLEHLDDAQTLLVVVEPPLILHEEIQSLLSGMAERWMTEIVGKGNCLSKVFVETKGTGHGTTE